MKTDRELFLEEVIRMLTVDGHQYSGGSASCDRCGWAWTAHAEAMVDA